MLPAALLAMLTPAQARKLLKEAEGKHVCSFCHRAFDRASGLAIHVRSHSGVRRTSLCPIFQSAAQIADILPNSLRLP